MSNFICSTCGITNIDCGKAGYKTAREIELELEKKIAVKALSFYAKMEHCRDACELNCTDYENIIEESDFGYYKIEGFYSIENGEKARKALKEIGNEKD